MESARQRGRLRSVRHTYVLRVWAEPCRDEARSPLWRFSLERIPGGERIGFTEPAALVNILQDLITGVVEAPNSEGLGKATESSDRATDVDRAPPE